MKMENVLLKLMELPSSKKSKKYHDDLLKLDLEYFLEKIIRRKKVVLD